MFENTFGKKPVKQKSEDCKIKMKVHTDGSKSVSFSGNCNATQVQMAKEAMGADTIEKDESS